MNMETKVVDLSIKAPKTDIVSVAKKEKPIRKTMEEWKLDPKYLNYDTQLECIATAAHDDPGTLVFQELHRQVCAKISGYKSQDMKKALYDESKFVRFDDVIKLMCDRKMLCFYCQKQAMLFYEHVRESNQWTLERIDNTRGHNTDNVEIACLNCNLRRRTMYHERYVFTKQMGTVKLLD